MADARITEQALHIGLHQSQHRAIENADYCQHAQQGGELVESLREKRDAEAQNAIGSGLRHRASQHSCDWRWRLAIGIWQPAMEGHKRHLDHESRSHGQEEPGLYHRIDLAV